MPFEMAMHDDSCYTQVDGIIKLYCKNLSTKKYEEQHFLKLGNPNAAI